MYVIMQNDTPVAVVHDADKGEELSELICDMLLSIASKRNQKPLPALRGIRVPVVSWEKSLESITLLLF